MYRNLLSAEESREVHDVSPAVLDDEEAVQEPERRRRHCESEQIHRGDFVLVVVQESDPAFHLIGFGRPARQVTRHRHFREKESRLRELRVGYAAHPIRLAPSS